MKKLFIASAIALSCLFTNEAKAQSALSSLLSGLANQAVSDVTSNTANSSAGGLISNLISAVTGDLTTTEASIKGTWTYTKPCVQFESEDMLTKAGGTVISEKAEAKLASIYKTVGIKAGRLNFTFDGNGNVTYGVGSITRTGTYVFNKSDKTIDITTTAGVTIKTYVTVSGNEMSLTFDGTKFLNLMTTLGSKFQVLGTAVSIAKSYDGMKVGFKLTKQ